MKATIAKYTIGLLLLTATSNAATVIVSAGFGATQGLEVKTGLGVLIPTFTVAVGTFSGGVFTTFGSAIQDTGKVSAAGIAATGPSTFNAQVIALYVGTGPVGEAASEFVVLRTNANTAFPADVSGTGSSTFTAALGSNLTLLGNSTNGVFSPTATLTGGGTINLGVIPEPSAALLGALGALGLLRRRRN